MSYACVGTPRRRVLDPQSRGEHVGRGVTGRVGRGTDASGTDQWRREMDRQQDPRSGSSPKSGCGTGLHRRGLLRSLFNRRTARVTVHRCVTVMMSRFTAGHLLFGSGLAAHALSQGRRPKGERKHEGKGCMAPASTHPFNSARVAGHCQHHCRRIRALGGVLSDTPVSCYVGVCEYP